MKDKKKWRLQRVGKTIQEINERISKGQAVVVTAEEVIGLVRRTCDELAITMSATLRMRRLKR